MARLRDALGDFASGYVADLPREWGRALQDVDLAVDDVDASLTFDSTSPIYPARRGAPLAAARADAHTFRAFDGLPAGDVRCVLLGQDPYPRVARATGRSFEQGDLDEWPDHPGPVATSLRCLVQFLAHARAGDDRFLAADGWRRLRDAARDGTLDLDSPRDLFDRWQARGVLCLNAGLTLTRYAQGGAPEQLRGHIPFWAPVVGGVLRHLAVGSDRQVVFLLLGQAAQALAESFGLRQVADAAGAWGSRVRAVRLSHPAATGFLQGVNPFREVDLAFDAMGAEPVGW